MRGSKNILAWVRVALCRGNTCVGHPPDKLEGVSPEMRKIKSLLFPTPKENHAIGILRSHQKMKPGVHAWGFRVPGVVLCSLCTTALCCAWYPRTTYFFHSTRMD